MLFHERGVDMEVEGGGTHLLCSDDVCTCEVGAKVRIGRDTCVKLAEC